MKKVLYFFISSERNFAGDLKMHFKYNKLLRACSGFSAEGKNEGFFSQFLRFWRSIVHPTQLKKGEKWLKKNRFGLSGKIPNTLLHKQR